MLRIDVITIFPELFETFRQTSLLGAAREAGTLSIETHDLRSHTEVRGAYAALKLELATVYADDRLAYTDAKTGFILDAIDQAEGWAAETGWSVR